MFASKSSKFKLSHNIHGKSYEELLTVSSDISVHLRILVIEVYKSLMKTNKTLHYTIKHYTIKPITYDLHTGEKLYLSTVSTARYGPKLPDFPRKLVVE